MSEASKRDQRPVRQDLAGRLFRLIAKPGERFDESWNDDIVELIRTEGDLVGRQEWDSGNPGAGAGSVDVYLFRGVFVAFNDAEEYGPYKTFLGAARAVGLLRRNSATVSVWVAPEYTGTGRGR